MDDPLLLQDHYLIQKMALLVEKLLPDRRMMTPREIHHRLRHVFLYTVGLRDAVRRGTRISDTPGSLRECRKELPMAHYLIQAAYTAEVWAAQLRNPQHRVEVVRPLFERLGARIEVVYYAFGEYDLIIVVEAPDNVSAAALSLAVTASGTAKAFKTTPLLTVEEGVEAMRKGGDAATLYTPPGS
ncbi:MAG: GYD domain-containing protein [Thermomicrobiales bacterium]